jgi:signal peptidase II
LKRTTLIFFTIIVVLIIDQWLKVHIKLTYPIGEGFKMFGQDWARIHFVENKGMAFGLEMGGAAGKYALSIFRILMVGLLGYIIKGLVQVKESKWLIVCFSLIIAGAIGNIIDSMVYGLIFSASSFHGPVAQFMPESGGYAPFLQGKVVDMFHFPMVTTTWPEWVPKWGGSSFEFFRPVFNVADAAISVGVIAILLFHRRFFTKPEDVKTQSGTTNTATSNVGSSEEE